MLTADAQAWWLAGVIIALLFCHLLILSPLHHWPSISLTSFVLFPFAYTGVPPVIGRLFAAPVLVLFLWAVLSLANARQRGPKVIRLLPFAFLAFLLPASVLGQDPLTSLAWSLVAAVCVPLVASASQCAARDPWPAIIQTVAILGALLGTVTILEVLTGWTPWTQLYADHYAALEWQVFRAKASLGHPLMVSLVASVFAALLMFERGVPALLRWAGLAGSLVAIALSASRSGVAAVAVTLTLTIAADVFHRRVKGAVRIATSLRLLALGGVSTALLFSSPLLESRNLSSGGAASVDYRNQIAARFAEAMRDALPFGYGPGTAAEIFPEKYGGLILENSVFQVMLSLGLFVIPVAAFLVWSLVRAARMGRTPGFAGIVAFSVSVAAFNVVEAVPSSLLLLAFPLVNVWRPASFDSSGSLHGRGEQSRRSGATNAAK